MSNIKNNNTMKAIVNVSKKSAMANLNGNTFDILQIYNQSVDLNVNGVTTAFGFKEIFIVNIQKELKDAFDAYCSNGNFNYWKLVNYLTETNTKVDVQLFS